MADADFRSEPERLEALKNIATAVYALQAAGFVVGFTAIIAVVIDYVKRDDARGTWLEPHFRWQIRTFWFGLFWSILGMMMWAVVIGFFVLLGVTVWLIYRIVKGWLRLSERRSPYP